MWPAIAEAIDRLSTVHPESLNDHDSWQELGESLIQSWAFLKPYFEMGIGVISPPKKEEIRAAHFDEINGLLEGDENTAHVATTLAHQARSGGGPSISTTPLRRRSF